MLTCVEVKKRVWGEWLGFGFQEKSKTIYNLLRVWDMLTHGRYTKYITHEMLKYSHVCVSVNADLLTVQNVIDRKDQMKFKILVLQY